MSQVSMGITEEVRILLISFLAGAVLVTVYDVLRICRRMIRHRAAVVVIEDIIYWIFCALAVAAMYYEVNDGLIRGFALGGVAAGMLLDNQLISPLIIRFFCFFLGKVLGIFGRPLRFCQKLLKKIWKLVKMSLCKL